MLNPKLLVKIQLRGVFLASKLMQSIEKKCKFKNCILASYLLLPLFKAHMILTGKSYKYLIGKNGNYVSLKSLYLNFVVAFFFVFHYSVFKLDYIFILSHLNQTG